MDIAYFAAEQKFILTTANTAYCLGVDAEGNLQHIYWGKRLYGPEDYPSCRQPGQTIGIGKNLANPKNLSLQCFYYPYEAGKAVVNEEYAGWGGLNFSEPCLKVVFADGVRDLVLKYHGHAVDEAENSLTVTLKDCHYPLSSICGTGFMSRRT